MSRQTLYAYVDGSDLSDIADELQLTLERFVETRRWRSVPWVVNQQHDNDTTLRPGDLPGWDLGLNMELPDPDEEPPGWFSDVEDIARFLVELRARIGRGFVIGIGDESRGIAEDLYDIGEGGLDLEQLRRIIGVRDDVRGAS